MHRCLFRRLLLFSLLVAFCAVTATSSSLAVNIPPGEDIGAQSQRFKQDIARKESEFAREHKSPFEIETPPPKTAPQAETVSFTLTAVSVTGTTIFRPEDLKPLYEKYLKTTVTFADLEAILEAIRSKYKKRGHLTTIVYFPEQDITGGSVEIRVLEGRVGKVSVEGARWFPAKFIQRQVHTQRGEVLHVPSLERDTIRLNKNSDLELKTVLTAGAEEGTSDIVMTAKDSFPVHVGASFDNEGSRLAGVDRTFLFLRDTNVTNNGDTLFGSIMLARDSNAQSIGYMLPIDTYGTKLGVNYSHFHLKIGQEYKDLLVTGDTKIITPYITKELSLTQAWESSFSAGIDIESVLKRQNAVTTSNDQLRVPYLSYDMRSLDASGETTWSFRTDFGTSGFLGASPVNHSGASRDTTGGFFFKYGQTLRRVQKMPLDSYAIIRGQFQASPQTLAPSEQLQIGGANTVRGYPEGDFIADTGVILSIDWIFPSYPIPPSFKIPFEKSPLRYQIEPLVFLDLGGGHLNKKLPGERRDKFLAGTGAGLRVQLFKNIFCRFEWAIDIGADPTQGAGSSTFHISVQGET